MFKEYKPQYGRYDSAFGAWLDSQIMSGLVDLDRECRNEGNYVALIGRRLIEANDYGATYERFDNYADAEREFELREFPSEWDNMISEGYSRDGDYGVSCEGVHIGSFDTREEAEFALAKEMVNSGCFGDSWFIGERGNYERIDDAVREYHDEGGDKMAPLYSSKPIEPTSTYGCGAETCVACNGNYAWRVANLDRLIQELEESEDDYSDEQPYEDALYDLEMAREADAKWVAEHDGYVSRV